MRKISFFSLVFFVFCALWYTPACVAMRGIETRMVDTEGGSFLLDKEMPRVIVLILEQNVGQEYPSYGRSLICEGIIRSRFLDKGFAFADHRTQTERIDIEKFSRSGGLSDEDARSLGKSVNAELVIVGKALARCAGNVAGTTMKSFLATITAKAIRTDNGVIIASASADGAAIHIDDIAGGSEAIEKAAMQMANLLRSRVIAKWQKKVIPTTIVAVTVRGIKSCSDFVRFKEALKTEIRGIKNIYPRRMESGTIRLDLDVQGNAQSLADELTARNFSGFSLDITDIGQNNIELRLFK